MNHPNLFSPGDHRELVPPDPFPNSTVKRFIADDSVGFPHVKVGHRQAPHIRPRLVRGRFCLRVSDMSESCPHCAVVVGFTFRGVGAVSIFPTQLSEEFRASLLGAHH